MSYNRKQNNFKRNRTQTNWETFSVDEYFLNTYDPNKLKFGDKSKWPIDRQMKHALSLGTEKWKEYDHNYVTPSEERRKGRKGWSKSKQRRKHREELQKNKGFDNVDTEKKSIGDDM